MMRTSIKESTFKRHYGRKTTEMTTKTDQPVSESTPVLEKSKLESTLQVSPHRNEPCVRESWNKLIRNRTEQQSPWLISFQMYLENRMNGEQEETIQTAEENPHTITVVDSKSGYTVWKKNWTSRKCGFEQKQRNWNDNTKIWKN